MPSFKSKTIKGQTYTFDHLESFSFKVSAGDAERTVLVHFSCHCFTEDFKPSHTPDFKYTHEGEVRAFDFVRYELSQQLPGLIQALGGRSVYMSVETNYFVLQQNAHARHPGPYLVFFNLEKAKKAGADVIMYIESAYLKPNMADRASPVKFQTLVEKTSLGQKVPRGPIQKIKRK